MDELIQILCKHQDGEKAGSSCLVFDTEDSACNPTRARDEQALSPRSASILCGTYKLQYGDVHYRSESGCDSLPIVP